MRLRFGEFVMDPDSRQLFRSGDEVHLPPKIFELLDLLVRSRAKALSKRHIQGQLWPDAEVGEASLTVAVAGLRSALGESAKEPRHVRTVHGFGYAFAGEVQPEGERGVRSVGVAPRVLWEERIIPLLEGDNVLGRDQDVTIRIDAPGVSRRHARIRVSGVEATIEDLGSKNGTYVGAGGPAITAPTPLPNESRFRLGRVLLVFRSSNLAGSTTTELSG